MKYTHTPALFINMVGTFSLLRNLAKDAPVDSNGGRPSNGVAQNLETYYLGQFLSTIL